MNPLEFARLLHRKREDLIDEWKRRLAQSLGPRELQDLAASPGLVAGAFEEIVALFAPGGDRLPRRHDADAFSRPGNPSRVVDLCLAFFEIGRRVIATYIVENAGCRGTRKAATCDRLLGELDAIIHILAHRDIEALCGPRLREAGAWRLDRPIHDGRFRRGSPTHVFPHRAENSETEFLCTPLP